jgi:hypothetical protein
VDSNLIWKISFTEHVKENYIEVFTNLLIDENFEDLDFVGYSRICGSPIFSMNRDKVFRRKLKLDILNGCSNRKLFFKKEFLLKELFENFYDKYNVKIEDIEFIRGYAI